MCYLKQQCPYAAKQKKRFAVQSPGHGFGAKKTDIIIVFHVKNAYLDTAGVDAVSKPFFNNSAQPSYLDISVKVDNAVHRIQDAFSNFITDSPRAFSGGISTSPKYVNVSYDVGNLNFKGAYPAFVIQAGDTLTEYHLSLHMGNVQMDHYSTGTTPSCVYLENVTHRPNINSSASITVDNAFSDNVLILNANTDTTYATVVSGNYFVSGSNPVVSISPTASKVVFKDCYLKNNGSAPAISGPANSSVRVAGVYGDSELLDTDINFVRFEYGDNNASLSRDAGIDLTIPSNTGYSVPFSSNNYTSSNYTVAGDSAFTVQSAGVYEITFSGNLQVTSGTAQTTSVDIYRNAAVVGATSTCYVSTNPTHFSTTKIVSLSKGDVIKLKIPPTDWAGSTVKVLFGSNFTIKRIQ